MGWENGAGGCGSSEAHLTACIRFKELEKEDVLYDKIYTEAYSDCFHPAWHSHNGNAGAGGNKVIRIRFLSIYFVIPSSSPSLLLKPDTGCCQVAASGNRRPQPISPLMHPLQWRASGCGDILKAYLHLTQSPPPTPLNASFVSLEQRWAPGLEQSPWNTDEEGGQTTLPVRTLTISPGT